MAVTAPPPPAPPDPSGGDAWIGARPTPDGKAGPSDPHAADPHTADPTAGDPWPVEPGDDVPAPGGTHSPRWSRGAVAALLLATAAAYLWGLGRSGYANSFYAAAVQAGTKSWKAFFFGSLDASNFITVDKSPASLWVMELSGRLFGFSARSMLVPQVLEGVAAVWLLVATVRRWFGPVAGLLAGALLAITPVAALMFRFNNPDALMVLALVAAAYTLTRALERGATGWVAATGALIGVAFLAKMLQAFTVLPAFAGVYLLAAPGRMRRRVAQVALGGLGALLAAGWWVVAVALWPVTERPMIDGSPDNNILNLIFGYNGLGRLTGSDGGGATFSGAPGIFRLFNDLMGGQASWLLPAASVVLVVGVAARGRAPRTDRTRAALVLWGGWLVVTGAVFSLSSGVIHTYYTVALAPAVAALVAIGSVLAWRARRHPAARLAAAAALGLTAVWSFLLLGRTPSYLPWLRVTVLTAGILSAFLVMVQVRSPRRRPLLGAGIGLGLVAVVGGPLAFTVTTLRAPHTGSTPSAGPASLTAAPGPGLTSGPGGASRPGGAAAGHPVTGGEGAGGTRPSVDGGAPTGAVPAARSAPGGTTPGSGPTDASGAAAGRGGATASQPGGGAATGSPGGAGGGGPQGSTVGPALSSALRHDASRYRWVAATFGSTSAADLELATGDPVMAIGGFNGHGGNIGLAAFEALVARGEVHYFVVSGSAAGGPGGPGGGTDHQSAISSWVKTHFTAETIGGRTVYDLTRPKG